MTSDRADADDSLPDDIVASRLANSVSLATIEAVYADDAYGNGDGWAEEVSGLGPNE